MKFAKWVPAELREEIREELEDSVMGFDPCFWEMISLILESKEGASIFESLQAAYGKSEMHHASSLDILESLALWMLTSLNKPPVESLTRVEASDKIRKTRAAIRLLKLELPLLGLDSSLYEFLPSDSVTSMLVGFGESPEIAKSVVTSCKLTVRDVLKRRVGDGGNVTNILTGVDQQLKKLSSEPRFLTQPNEKNADRVFFIKNMHDFFMAEFNRPLVSTIARIAQIVLEDSSIDRTLVENCIRRHRKSMSR